MNKRLTFALVSLLILATFAPLVSATTKVYVNADFYYTSYNSASVYASAGGMNTTSCFASWNCSVFSGIGSQPERNFRLYVSDSCYYEAKIVKYAGNWLFSNKAVINNVDYGKTDIPLTVSTGANDSQVLVTYENKHFVVAFGYNGTLTKNVWNYTTTDSWHLTGWSVGGASSSWSAGDSWLYVDGTSSVERMSYAVIPIIVIFALLGALGVSKTRKG